MDEAMFFLVKILMIILVFEDCSWIEIYFVPIHLVFLKFYQWLDRHFLIDNDFFSSFTVVFILWVFSYFISLLRLVER